MSCLEERELKDLSLKELLYLENYYYERKRVLSYQETKYLEEITKEINKRIVDKGGK